MCVSCYVRIDARACIDYTRIVQSVPCHALCPELKFVFTVSMHKKSVRSLIRSITAMQFPSRHRILAALLSHTSVVAVKHTSPLVIGRCADWGQRFQNRVTCTYNYTWKCTCTFQCRSTPARDINLILQVKDEFH